MAAMVSQDDLLRVAEFFAARITHDLSSGIGVLAMLLELGSEPAGEEPLAVAGETAAQLVERLRLLRAAWGPAGEPLPAAALPRLAAGLMQSRCKVMVDGMAPGTVFSPEFGRLALNLLLLGAESLPGGGDIAFSGSDRDLVVVIAGPHAAWPRELSACLVSPEEAVRALRASHTLQLGFTVLLARSTGLRLSPMLPAGPHAGPLPLRVTAGNR
jgi:hypothetical protein